MILQAHRHHRARRFLFRLCRRTFCPRWRPIAPPGASSCSGCHPVARSVDTPVKRLVGRQSGPTWWPPCRPTVPARRAGTVMDRIAKGFTDDEIKAIGRIGTRRKKIDGATMTGSPRPA